MCSIGSLIAAFLVYFSTSIEQSSATVNTMIDVDTRITYVCLHSLDRIGEGRVGNMQQIGNALFWPCPSGPVFSNAALL